jgi:hypothetical protein
MLVVAERRVSSDRWRGLRALGNSIAGVSAHSSLLYSAFPTVTPTSSPLVASETDFCADLALWRSRIVANRQ